MAPSWDLQFPHEMPPVIETDEPRCPMGQEFGDLPVTVRTAPSKGGHGRQLRDATQDAAGALSGPGGAKKDAEEAFAEHTATPRKMCFALFGAQLACGR